MPIFDNELIDNVRKDGSLEGPDPVLGSSPGTKLDLGTISTGGASLFGPVKNREFSLNELREIKGGPQRGFAQPFASASTAELLANKRYPVYERGVDLENIYGLQQSWYQQLGNGIAKLGGNLVGTYAQSLTNIPNTISAFKSGSVEERMARLSGDPDGYEGTIDNWMKNIDDVFPNYMTRYERDHPFSTAIPFTRGSANWWGGKFLPNLGFMGGAVLGAVTQDIAIAAVTEGIGEIPLVAAQIGKASLYLNKLFSSETKLDRVLTLGKTLRKTDEQLLKVTELAELSAAARVGSGFRYGMAIYGSAMTEAGVESRDAYRQVKDDLTKQYVAENGVEPDFVASEQIENYATNAMNARFGINMALLTASNTLQFGNLFKSITAAKGAVQSLEGIGKIGLAEGSLDVFEKKAAKTIAGKVWESVKPGVGNVFREGVFEEGAQFAAERGTYDYFTRKYKSDKYKETWDDLNEVIKSTTFGMKEQFGSQEGIENMLIGGLTGLLVGKVQNIYENKKGIGKDARIASALNVVNRFGITNTLQRSYDSTATQAGIAKDMAEAAKSGDVFKYKNFQEDAFFDFVNYRLPSGMHDVTLMQLEMLKDLPKDQFEQMFQLDFNETNKSTVNSYVDALVDRANEIKKTSDAINSVFTNPFKNSPKEGNIESQVEADNYQTFEEYKLDLAYYASIAPNVNRRISSVQQDLNNIALGVTTDLIDQLTDNGELKTLADSYEEKANQLNSTITEFTSVKDKINIKNQVKALRTRSEKIARALGDGNVSSIFKDILNFELNGQDATKDDVVSAVQIDKLIGYGVDVNKLLERKKTASVAYDKLATREGFEKYFEQAEEVAADKEKEAEGLEEIKEPTVKTTEEKKPATYKNKAGVEEPIEVNREYQIPKAKVASIKKIADDRWEVSYPGGTTSFHKTKEDADAEAADINDTLGNIQKVKVVGINDNGSIKVEDLKGDIFNINLSRIQGYEKVESKEEKFGKVAGDINRQQDELEKQNGGINVGDTSTASSEKAEKEGKLKSYKKFFVSGITQSEDFDDPSQSAPHLIRSRVFLNNAKNFKNRQKLASIIVTPNQLSELGLGGLVQTSYNLPADSDIANIPDVNNIDLGFVAQVFVEVDGSKIYFVDEKGDRISELDGKPTDLSRVVFQNMPTTEIYYKFKDKNGNPVPRFREGEKDIFQAYANSWGSLRAQLFKAPAFPIKPYKFSISRGVAKTNKIGDQYERNAVGSVIIPENKIANQQGLIVINTEGSIVHQGEIIGWPKGNPAIQYGDTLEYINNTKLGNNKAKTIYQVFKALSEDIMKQFESGKKVKLSPAFMSYLQNVLYFKKGAKAGSNQFYIDTATMSLSIGDKFYKLDDIANKESEIVEQLKELFHNLNSFTLKDKFYSPFYEYVYDNGQLSEIQWENYQSYLLKSKYPDGKARSTEETPFLTNVAKPTAAVPYSFKQKYATLIDFELPPIEMPKAPPVAAATPSTSPMIGTFEMNGEKVNTFNGFDSGPVDFTGIIDKNGKPKVEVIANDTITKVAANKQLVNQTVIPMLKAIVDEEGNSVYDPSADDVKLATTFVAYRLGVELEKLQQSAAPTSTAGVLQPNVSPVAQAQGTARTEPVVTAVSTDDNVGYISIGGFLEKDREKVIKNANTVLGADIEKLKSTLDEFFKKNNLSFEEGLSKYDTPEYEKKADNYVKPRTTYEFITNQYGQLIIPESGKESNIHAYISAYKNKNRLLEKFKNPQLVKVISTSSVTGKVTKSEPYNVAPTAPVSTDAKADIERRREAIASIKLETRKVMGQEESYYISNEPSEFEGTNIGGFTKQEVIDKINAKYDKLAALKGAKPDEYNPNEADLPEDNYMRIGVNEDDVPMTDAELEAFKQWHAEKVPGIPFEVLENTVTTYDNEKAFGVFENGVAKFHKLAPATAPYHEVGEGIWKAFLTPEQRRLILDDERTRSGQFTDRASRKKIYYADATDQQLKERIWDDYAEFRAGKIKAKSLGQKVLAFFRNIMEFFKSFVQKPSMKEQLFKAIDNGKFKDMGVSDRVKKEAPEYMRIPGLTGTAAYEFVQDMTIRAGQEIFGRNKKLIYELQKVSGEEVFNKIEQLYIKENKRTQFSDAAWQMLKARTRQKLRTIGVSFNEENVVNINDADTSGAAYAPEAFSVDWKKFSSFAVKFLASILPITLPTNQEYSTSAKLPQREISDQAKGYKLVNSSRIFATLFNKLANTTNPRTMGKKLSDIAKEDSDFMRFFQYMGGNLATGEIDFGKFEYEDWRLYINFFQTFSLQKPEALIQYVNGSEVYTAPANQFTLAKEIQNVWYEAIKSLAENPKSLIFRDRVNKTYKVKPVNPNNPNDPNAFPKERPKEIDDQDNFLKRLGVSFGKENYFKLDTEGQGAFADAVGNIHFYLQTKGDIGTIGGKTLGIQSQMSTLANLLIKASNPIQDSTFPGVDGKRVQSSTQNNVPSVFENEFNSANTLEELIQIRPELQDVFSKNSVVLMNNGLFYNSDGERKKRIKVSYIQGEKINETNVGTTTSKLTLGRRITQELNQNLDGRYYILIPADSSTEWMMDFGNYIIYEDVTSGRALNKMYKVFNGYLEDDIALALDWENRSKLKNVGDKAKELRFFKEILSTFDKDGNLVPSEVLKGINERIDKGESLDDIKSYINEGNNQEEINRMIKIAIDDNVARSKEALMKNGQLKVVNEGYSFPGLTSKFVTKKDVGLNKFKLSEEEVNDVLTFAKMNYMIANMEFHKILIGDPYQFKIKDGRLDETKRVKSLLSPRRVTFNDPDFNTHLNDKYNKAGDIQLVPGEIGYHLHKDHLNTVTIKDVEFASSHYDKVNEADADSWLMDSAYKEAKLKNGQWSPEAEQWYQWQMAYTRQNLPGYSYKNTALEAQDKETLKKPEPKFVIEKFKPVATGTKAASTNIDLVVDKFAQLPIFYKAVEGRNLAKLYEKMWNENIDYVVMVSGRKVGAQELQSFYNDKNQFNNTPYTKDSIVEVPWKAWGIQVENSYENPKDQTWGSQPAKISSMDMFDNGVETIPGAKEAYDKYTEATKKYHQNKYNQLLKKLGIRDLGNGFELFDKVAIAKTLEGELFRRALSQNAIDTIQLDENREWRIPFESSTEYKKIKDILYSMINKSLVSPKLNGGPKAMSSVTLWEKGDRDPNAPNPELKFYTKDDMYCEVYLPYKFRNKFNKRRFPTDESILKYLNSSPEGKQILQGVAFRIPTDALNKIETYRIKGFLPEFMEGIAIVPSELTTKAGLDFDFDKLNTYLKSVYTDEKGNVRLVKYLSSEEATKEHFSKVFDIRLEKQKVSKAEILEALQILDLGLDDPNNLVEKYSELLDILLEDATPEDRADVLVEELEKLGDKNLQASLKEKYVEDMYNRSLENEYFQTMENMLTLRGNFERLISPTDDAGLKKESEDINKWKGVDERTIKNRLLDSTYMSTLRHYFITGKRWVGIAATNITSHALFQKTQVYLDPVKVSKLSKFDSAILGVANGGEIEIILPHNKVNINGKKYMSMSGTKTADGKNQYISARLSGWATSVVDVANDPYIMDIIDSDLLIGPAMFMERMGAGKYVSKFLQQPIIREYISYLESIGEKGLFKDKNIQYIKSRFSNMVKPGESMGVTFDIDKLDDNIKDYYSHGNQMSSGEKDAEQEAILNEFLKYAKLATFSFKFSQSINYDTAKSRNSDSFSRKQTRTSINNQTNIFSSPDKVLDSSFIGNQRDLLDFAMSAMGSVFKLKSDKFSIITDSVIAPYELAEYMTEDDFETVTSKADASFLDYIIQIKSKLNNELAELTMGDDSVPNQLLEAKKKYPNNKLLADLDVVTSDLEGGATTIKFRVKPKDAADIDVYTDLMREFSEIDPVLFNNIVKLAIIQGSYEGATSIKMAIPLEEYSTRIKPIIDTLAADDDIKAFAKVGAFQRNNWKDDLVMPPVNIIKTFKENENVPFSEDQYGNIYEKHESFLFPIVDKLGVTQMSRKILTLSPKYNSGDVVYDYVKVPRIVKDPNSDFMVDVVEGMSLPISAYNSRRASGDKSLDEVLGYKKVKDDLGNPVTTNTGAYVYKLINLWGDGSIASEYYTDGRKSIYNNNTVQIDEIPDRDIINHYGPVVKAENNITPTQQAPAAQPVKTDDLQKTITELNLEPQEYEIVTMFGKQQIVNKTFVPQRIKKGFSKFYSKISYGLSERYGKKVVIPGFEDIELMMEQDTNEVYEISTGLNVPTKTLTQKAVKAEVEELFKTKDIRGILASVEKLGASSEFDKITEFSADRRREIIINFATKHKMTEEQAKNQINYALQKNRENTIAKLKECY